MYRVAVVDPQASTRVALCDLLRRMESARLEKECGHYDLFVEVIFEVRPDVALVALEPDCQRALKLIAELAARFPGLRIFAVMAQADATLLVKVLRGGGSGYLSLPITAEKLQGALGGTRESGDAPAARMASEVDEVACEEEPMDEDVACDEEPMDKAKARVPFPPQPVFTGMLRSIRQTSKRLWRCLPFTGTVGDLVDCTVFAPPTVAPGETVFVQVFAHLPEQAKTAWDYAREFDDGAARRGFRSLEAEVKRGAKLTFHFVMAGTDIDNPVQHLVWRGEPASVQFGVDVPRKRSPGILLGTVGVSLDSIPLGHVKFKLTVGQVCKEFTRARPGPVGEAAHCYRRAFISYATSDRPEVLKRVQLLARLGIEYFQDVLKLEPGDRWEKQLYRHIEESDLFLLFWSTSASNSEWVLKEVRYALQCKKGDDFAPPEIKPVVIEGPPPPAPPMELAHLHFNDYILYFMNPQGERQA